MSYSDDEARDSSARWTAGGGSPGDRGLALLNQHGAPTSRMTQDAGVWAETSPLSYDVWAEQQGAGCALGAGDCAARRIPPGRSDTVAAAGERPDSENYGRGGKSIEFSIIRPSDVLGAHDLAS
jgi:hypothetical protein